MESFPLFNFEALSATMIRCPGRNVSPAVHLKLSGVPLKHERMQMMIDLAEYAMCGPLFVPMWHGDNMYLHPDDDVVISETRQYFEVIKFLGLDHHIHDIPYEDYNNNCPGHVDEDDITDVHPEVLRMH